MSTERVLVPDFYNEFACLGPKCPDNCCRDWGEIPIDKETYNKYIFSTSTEFAKKAKTAFQPITEAGGKINPQRAAVLILNEQMICPFLTEDKLCEIHKKMGTHWLSTACTNYPKLGLKNLKGNLEAPIALSCIEVARIALLRNSKQKFIKINIDKKSPLFKTAPLVFNPKYSLVHSFVIEIRQACIDIMQNEELSIQQRIFKIAGFLHNLDQAQSDGKGEDEIKSLIKEKNDAMQKEINISAEQIMLAIQTKRFGFKKFIELVREIMKDAFGKEIADKMSVCDIHKHITDNSREKLEEILKNNALIFENYFVNLMFQYTFPFTHKPLNMFLHTFLMMEKLEVLRLFLGTYAIKGEIETEHIINVVCKMEKNLGHGNSCAERILEFHGSQEP